MENRWVSFRKYAHIVQTEALKAFLTQHQIDFEVLENSVNLKTTDVIKVGRLLDACPIPDVYQSDKNYYLFHFSNQDLLDRLENPTSYGNHEYALSQKILHERGIDITPQLLALLATQGKIKKGKAEPKIPEKLMMLTIFLFLLMFVLLINLTYPFYLVIRRASKFIRNLRSKKLKLTLLL